MKLTVRPKDSVYSPSLGYEINLLELEKEHGVVKYDNINVYLIQDPYPSGDVTYTAAGIDVNDNRYDVFWTLKKEYQNRDDWSDEGDCCNWKKYKVVKL